MTDLIKQLTGRARFCRDRGEEKTPGLLEEAAAQLAEAQAAQAMVVERCADRLSDLIFWTGDDDNGTTLVSLREAKAAIRALADPTGVKLLAELRAERDALAADGAGVFWAEKARAFAMQMASVDARAKDVEAERDTLAAANAVLEAKVAGLRAAFRVNMLRFGPPGTSHEEIDAAIDAALATQEAGA